MSDELNPDIQETNQELQQPFYFDEFFSDNEGVEIKLLLRGRQVPLRIRRGLTIREKITAQAAAVKRKIDLKTGQVVIDRIDETAAAEELAYLMLLSWPFINRDGSPVEITRENVAKLIGMDKLIELVKKMEDQGDAALDPFVSPSVAASETPPASDQPSSQEVSLSV